MKLLKTLACLTVAFGCSSPLKEDLTSYLQAPEQKFEPLFTLSFDSAFHVQNDSPSDTALYLRPHVYQDRELYVLKKAPSYQMVVFDLVSRRKIREFEISVAPNLPETSTTFQINNDSIYIIDSNLKALVVSDLAGKTIYSKDIRYPLDSATGPYSSLSFLPYYAPRCLSNCSEILLNISTASLNSSGVLNGEPLFAVLDTTMQLRPISTPYYEGIVERKKGLRYPYDLTFPYFLLSGNRLLVNHPLDHFLYLYDFENNIMIEQKTAASIRKVDIPLPYADDIATDPQQVWNFRVSTPFYEPLFYHEKVNLYSRALHHSQDVKLADGRLNDGSHRTTSVIILDENLEKVGEVFFDDGEYTIHGAVPTSDGLLLYSRDYEKGEYRVPNRRYSFKKITQS